MRYFLAPRRPGSRRRRAKQRPQVRLDVFITRHTSLIYLNTALSKQEYLSASAAKLASKEKASSDVPAPKRDKFSGLNRKAKRRKMAAEADKEFNDQAALSSSIRAAKKAQRPGKIGDNEPAPSFGKKKKDAGKGKKPGHASAKKKVLGKTSSFGSEMGGRRGGGSSEGIRAKKGDGGILGGKKGAKGKAGGGKSKGRR